ncbi:MAG: proline--tRNA ligase, partial [Oscillospiraceae bacterium]|nr:proline--tRNA ligase [Oscillospiraceae bacterium]
IKIANSGNCFIKSMWCGDRECEEKLKEVAGVSSRCIPFEQEHIEDVCPVCGKPAAKMVYWGKAD